MAYSLEQLIILNARFDGTSNPPRIVGNALLCAGIVRTPGGAAAGDYTITLSEPASDNDSVVLIGSAPNPDPTKFCGPSVVNTNYSASADGTTRRIIIADANGQPSDAFFVVQISRTLIGP